MHSPIALLTTLLLVTTSVSADATIFFTGNGGCSGSGSTQTVSSDGACRQLGGINAAVTTNVDAGCSVTVYTDSNCSNNPTTAGLNSCIVGTLNSFSYDC